MTEQEHFEKVADSLIDLGTDNYLNWPVSFLNILYAYEQWKDGAEWNYVLEVLNGTFDREHTIEKLQDHFNYPSKGD